MAIVHLNPIAENIRGRLSRKSPTVMRQKKYRAENGAVISKGAQEAYNIMNPRDYKKNPPKGAELQNINSFAQASRLTTLILRAGKYTDEEIDALPADERKQALAYKAQFQSFKVRFFAQLKTPDENAPILPVTDPAYNHNSSKIQRRQYLTLNTFIRAMLMKSTKFE